MEKDNQPLQDSSLSAEVAKLCKHLERTLSTKSDEFLAQVLRSNYKEIMEKSLSGEVPANNAVQFLNAAIVKLLD